jgi:hypothetical protein
MLQDAESSTDYSFESLYFKGSKNDERTPVVRQHHQSGNMWCVMQRRDGLALGSLCSGGAGWVMVEAANDPKASGEGKTQSAGRYIASMPLPSDYPESKCEMVVQIRLRTRPFYAATSICESLSLDGLHFSAPRKDESPYDDEEDNDFITLTQRFPLSLLVADATKSSVTLHLFNGRFSARMQRTTAASGRWLLQAIRVIARIVPSNQYRTRPTSAISTGSISARPAPRTPSGPAAAAVVAKEVVGAGFYGFGVPGWKGKFLRAVRKAMRLRVSKLLELIAGLQRVNVRSVAKMSQSLHSTGMFVLDSLDTLFLWLGSNTGKKQNTKAQEFLNKYIFDARNNARARNPRGRYCKLPFIDSKGKSIQRAPNFKVGAHALQPATAFAT